MANLDDLLAQYESPSTAGDTKNPETPAPTPSSDKLDDLLSQYGVEKSTPPEQPPQIYKQNPFVSTAKSTAASIANSLAGQPLEDIGEAVGSETLQKVGRGVRERMEKVQQENPSEIGSLEDIVKKPGAAVQTALGNLAPQIPLSMGGAYAGAKAGAMLPVPPQLKPITAAGGGILGAFLPNYFQEAAEMRSKQHETGAEDKSKAYLTAIPAGSLEAASNVLMAGKFLPKAVKQSAIGKAVGELTGDGLSASGSRLAHVGKQAAKGVAGEGATEYAQTALEQVGGGQDLGTEESQREREVSAALGAIGGGVVSGGLSAFDKRATEQQPSVPETPAAQQQPAAPETQDVDNIPVTEDFAEVPTGDERETIIVPPEQPAYTEAEITKLKTYVDGKTTASETAGRVSASPSLEKAAKQFGVYDESDDPATTLGKLRDIIYPPIKTDQEKIDEAGQQARDKLKGDIAAQYEGKPMSVVGRAATLSIGQGLSPEEQAAKEQKAAELEAEQQSVVDTDTGEVLTETPVTPTLDELVADYLQFPVETLQRQANLSTLTPEQREAIRIAKEQKIAEKEAQDALNQQETGSLYDGGSEQSGLRGEGERTTESGAGVPPEGQTDRNIPTTEEIITEPTIGEANGKSPDETAQTTSQEIVEEPLPPNGYTRASKQPNGKYKLFYVGTANEVFPGEDFSSAREARQYLEVARAKQSDRLKTSEEEAATEAKLEDAGITQKYPVDFAAHKEAAASRFNGHRELPENRDAQKKAYTEIQGMPIGIENPEGSVRKGKGWENVMKAHYGFFTGVKGADGDQLDLFVKPKLTQDALDNIQSVFVVDQINPSTKIFDEAKVMLGYKSLAAARKAYLENYTKGWRGLGAITEIPLADFKARIETGEAWDSPVAYTQDKTKTPGSRTPPKSTDELQNAIGKLGGIDREIADRSGFSDYKGRKYQYLFNKSSIAKTLDEMAENLRDYGYEVDGENDLIQKLTDSLNGTPFYTPEGFEAFAKYTGQEAISDEESRARNDFLVKVDASNISQDDKDAFRKDVLNGDFDSKRDYEILGKLIEKAELEEIDNIPSPLGDTPNLKHEENKDIDTVKSKFRDAVQKAYEEGDLDIPQYMVALDMLSSKDPEVLKGIQKFIDNLMPGYGELQRVKAKGSVNVKRLLALVGSSMYKANLADTSIKEMVQNSFDAVKEQIAKNKTLKGQGKIDVLVDSSHRLIAIRDNGVGMTKKTILDAFLTVAGSNKEGLEAGDASGGFGMAKAAFLYGNEKIYLRTVHNGKLSTLEATGAELLDKGVDLATVPTDEPNGTTIIVKVPENVTINGEERYVYFPYGHKSIEFFQKPLLNDDVTISYNNNYVDLQELVNGNADEGLSVNDVFDAAMFGGEVVPTGKNMDMSGYDKATTASFDWGSADIFIGKKRNKHPAHQILSAGVYQFDDSINLRGWDKVPYDILINVKPTVSADSANYPFNLKREGWKDLVEKDIGAMKAYIKQVAMGIEAQETVDVFKNIKAMPTIEVDDIGGETTFNVSDFIPKKEVAAATPSEVFTPPSVSISVGKVTGVDAKGETVTYVDVEAEKAKEKGQEASFKADKEAPTAKDFLLDFGIDPESPVYVNNTSFDFVENDPNIAVFFAELGNILMQAKRKVESLGLYGYKKLSDTPTFMGVSIDKQYHGVHVNVPFHGIFLNPLAVKGTKLPGIVAGLWETMVHEFTHIPEGNHDESFVMEYHNLSSNLAEDGFDIRMRVLLSKTLKKHKDSFLAARENYEASTTKNIARSLHEGEDGTGVTSRRTETTRQGSIEGATTDATSALQKQRENKSGEGFQRDASGDIAAQFSRRAPMRQTDLFADSPGELTALQTKQQIADYAAQKDKKRQGNGAEPPPLFSDYPGFMGQTDIEDTQASLEDTFKAMGKFDKAPETINHPDAERIRYVQDNFLDLLSELEKRPTLEFEIKC